MFSRLILLMLVPLTGCSVFDRPSIKTVLFQVVDTSTRKPLSGIEVRSHEVTSGFFYESPVKRVEWGKTDTNGEIHVTLDWNLRDHRIHFRRKGCVSNLLFFRNGYRSAQFSNGEKAFEDYVLFPPKQGTVIVIPFLCEALSNFVWKGVSNTATNEAASPK
jgi:hypothetical protein